jgi:hypothetical protein
MFLVGRNGSRFELGVVGYQFPAIEDDKWDSNWLNITIGVQGAIGSWSSTHPSLLAADVERLADWLEAIAEARPQDALVEFLEPNLAFELHAAAEEDVVIRVWFECESRPPWARADSAYMHDLWIDLDLARRDAAGGARDLRDQLERFPARA